ncbi:HNH endonuclease, partial [Halobacterium salinarum]|uniref:HNH endonuclease n=1 Tax=Halobacterium salinarum TaxID=2242 RepID=UPI002556BD74
VYEQDGYECQNCGARGGPHGNAELHAHHVVPKSKGGTHQLSNLVTVCKDCHKSVHGDQMAPKADQLHGIDDKPRGPVPDGFKRGPTKDPSLPSPEVKEQIEEMSTELHKESNLTLFGGSLVLVWLIIGITLGFDMDWFVIGSPLLLGGLGLILGELHYQRGLH